MQTDIVGANARVKNPQNIEYLFVGIPVTSVNPGATVDVNVPVNRPFRARKIVLNEQEPAPLAPNFLDTRLTSLKVNNIDQFINNEPIPIAAFSSDATAARLRGDTAQPGVGIDLRLFGGASSGNSTVAGGFFGEAAT